MTRRARIWHPARHELVSAATAPNREALWRDRTTWSIKGLAQRSLGEQQSRQGHAHLPAQRTRPSRLAHAAVAARRPTYNGHPAVNAAIVRAGTNMTGVTVLRMDRLFTPNGFTETIRYRGRDVRVRTADGIHLNVSGTAIAAKVIATALRKP